MPTIAIVPLRPEHEAAVESLLDRAFEPGRHTRTAYKVRGTARALATASFVALADGVVVGSIQCWPVALAEDAGRRWPLVMVGPVAVAPERQQGGLGRRLVETALAALDASGEGSEIGGQVLIGDPEYYGRFFGFSAERTARWRLPGPGEARRLLARGAGVPDRPGSLGPR
ncbi:GNAT family N-acetyltransferase [Sphingomonas rubra]|uniref:Predicted N-acetyltransferase YhbS n=1 Tax=Sphingomonas rubra TaxID=634430 RepID=A0A1I5U2Y0_9SPHN|nr:N-acetyltransferase [Sphingomonas rubra]SFP88926.1 Predicted N-acetyltransferase YhbS [Sphingomonas rubra]